MGLMRVSQRASGSAGQPAVEAIPKWRACPGRDMEHRGARGENGKTRKRENGLNISALWLVFPSSRFPVFAQFLRF